MTDLSQAVWRKARLSQYNGGVAERGPNPPGGNAAPGRESPGGGADGRSPGASPRILVDGRAGGDQ